MGLMKVVVHSTVVSCARIAVKERERTKLKEARKDRRVGGEHLVWVMEGRV